MLHNLICSKAVPEVIREQGGVPVRTQVGHSYIKQLMAETGAVFGGEHSAHYYFAAQLPGRQRPDRLVAACWPSCRGATRTCPCCACRSSATTRAARSTPTSTTRRMVIERIAAAFSGADQDRLDGLTVDNGSWWFNLRPSNTEPLLRLNLEAGTADECESRVTEVLSLITL